MRVADWVKAALALMCARMACGAEDNQILLAIVGGLAAEFQVMDFTIRYGAARLTPPAVAGGTSLRSCSYNSGMSWRQGCFGRTQFIPPSGPQSPRTLSFFTWKELEETQGRLQEDAGIVVLRCPRTRRSHHQR